MHITANEGIMIRHERRIRKSFLSIKEECPSHKFAVQADGRVDVL